VVEQGWRRPGAVDVHYPPDGGARAALLIGEDDRFAGVLAEHVAWLDRVEPYRPGAFFTRELPAIRAVLRLAAPVDLLIVDGYVDLSPDGRPGLGAHLHAETGVPVIGVAKTAFRSATHAIEVRRGGSNRPLHVTAAGLPAEAAAALVGRMAGRHRLPEALRRVDRLTRSVAGQSDRSSSATSG
jgi:deoxyribonuclease V